MSGAIGWMFSLSSAVVVMEVIWTYAWMLWISRWFGSDQGSPVLTIWSCLVQAVTAERLVHHALRKKWSLWRVRTIPLPVFILVLALLIGLTQGGDRGPSDLPWFGYWRAHLPSLILSFTFGLFLTWRGAAAGRESFSFYDVSRRFLGGLTGLIVLFLAWGVAGRPEGAMSASLSAYVVTYFAVGLPTLALMNLGAMHPGIVGGHRPAGPGVRWLSILAILVVIVLAVSVGLASIVHHGLAAAFFRALGMAAHGLSAALSFLLTPIAYVLDVLFSVGRSLFNWIIGFLLYLMGGRAPNDTPGQFERLNLSRIVERQDSVPPELLLILKWAFVALLAASAVLLIARTITRYRREEAGDEVEEVRESIWSSGSFRSDLHSFVKQILGWILPRKGAAERHPAAAGREASLGMILDTRLLTVRELYRMLLRQGRISGVARHPSETPYEYRDRFEGRAVEAAEEVRAITEAYVTDRYGGPEEEDLPALNSAFRSLQKKLTDLDS